MAWLIYASACPGFVLAAPPDGKQWNPIPELTDEFNTAALDHSKWDDFNPQWKGRVPGYFSKKNVKESGGYLELSARKEALPDTLKPYHDYTTAAVKSKQKVMYGYFEVRAKPMKAGVSSAFWFYDSQPDHWTEIDVYEIGAGAPKHEQAYHMNAHVFHNTKDNPGAADMNFPETWSTPWTLSDDYHLYALEWDEKMIKWYVDGKVVRTLDNTYWHYPLYVNFDTETMPEYFGLPSDDQLPGNYKIDYVRSWRQRGNEMK